MSENKNVHFLFFRNAFPPIRIWRRYVGLDPVPIVEELDKSEIQFRKEKEKHEENMKGSVMTVVEFHSEASEIQ